MRRCPLRQADDRVVSKPFERNGLLGELQKRRAADGDLLNFVDLLRRERIRHGRALCQNGEVGKAVLHGGEAVGGRVVRQADAHVRICAAVAREHLQKPRAQGKAARCDVDDTALQALVGEDLLFACLDALKRDGDVRVELLPLGREAHALRRAEKQRAAELGFELSDHTCHIGLVAVERRGGLREAAEFGGVIKDAVAVVADVHKKASSSEKENKWGSARRRGT